MLSLPWRKEGDDDDSYDDDVIDDESCGGGSDGFDTVSKSVSDTSVIASVSELTTIRWKRIHGEMAPWHTENWPNIAAPGSRYF